MSHPLSGKRVALVGNTDWNLYNFRLPVAVEAKRHGADVTLVTPPGPYVRSIREAGFHHREIQMSQRGLSPLQDTLLIGQLSRIYATEGFDLVHHCSIKPVIHGSLAARVARVGAVVNAVTGLGYVFSGEKSAGRQILRSLVEALYSVSLADGNSRVIFQNTADHDFFLERAWVSPERSTTIRGSGIDLDAFSPDPSLVSPEPVVLFLGRLLWDKGVGDFHDAAARLRASGSDAEFWIAGRAQPEHPGGVPTGTLEAWRQSGVVRLLGHRDDIRDVLRQAWIVVLPSVYGEGVPKSLLEAASLAKPLVAYDVGGCRDIVKAGVSGIPVPPGDGDALVEAIGRLLDDASLRERLGQGARRLAEEEFSLQSVLERTMDTYVAALRGTR